MKGNKQSHREVKMIRSENKETTKEETIENKPRTRKLSAVHQIVSNHGLKKEAELPTLNPSEKQTKSHVSIITNNDIYSLPQSTIAEQKPHTPLRFNSIHKPTEEETSRSYNPYIIKNEYDRYMKSGFILDPIKPIETKNVIDNQNQNQIRRYPSFNTKAKYIGPNNKINSNHANVSFSSEVISPYSRRDNHPYINTNVKNPVDNDPLINYARGAHVNKGFETEFQNFNNLNSFLDNKNLNLSNEQQKKLRYNKIDDDDDDDILYRNLKSNKSLIKAAKLKIKQREENSNSRTDDDDNDVIYQDEFDIINKMNRKMNKNSNLDLINSINKELKRIKTGYQESSSNA
jgi:hypothetical protein